MRGPQIQDQPRGFNTDYEEKLAQTIARHEELQKEWQKLVSSWEAERSQLRMKIVQLEHSLVDAIERSSNPLRTAVLSEEKIRLVDEAKRQWSAQWDAERNQLLAEINRLRSSEDFYSTQHFSRQGSVSPSHCSSLHREVMPSRDQGSRANQD